MKVVSIERSRSRRRGGQVLLQETGRADAARCGDRMVGLLNDSERSPEDHAVAALHVYATPLTGPAAHRLGGGTKPRCSPADRFGAARFDEIDQVQPGALTNGPHATSSLPRCRRMTVLAASTMVISIEFGSDPLRTLLMTLGEYLAAGVQGTQSAPGYDGGWR
ncbi:MAG: hypothetical protein V7646_557 [Pseudonocardia sp.]